MFHIRLWWLINVCIIHIHASSHWMVTESGFIQSKADSQFEMARPYDLLAFLNQDTRWDNIINLYHDLSRRQEIVNQLWSELGIETDVGRQAAMNKNCVKAGPLNLLDWYPSLLEDGRAKNIAEEEYLFYNPYYGQESDIPDCKKISSLTFSMFTFEHLESMIMRENLTTSHELLLPELISPLVTVDQFGNWVSHVLRRNNSSWLHYNMASLYWRVRGNAPKAIECSRRAIHYAPRQYKDIALLSLGSILHRSRRVDDAITVLGAAVDHDPTFAAHHYIIANAYAVMGDFNKSVEHFDRCLKNSPSFDLAVKHKYGTLCHAFLLKKLQAVRETLNKLREELVEYSMREAHWLKSQAAFLRTMQHAEEFDYRNVEKNCQKMSALTGLNIKEIKKGGDKNSLIQYFLDGPMYSDVWLSDKGIHALESAYSLQRLVKHIEKHANKVSDYAVPSDHFKMKDNLVVREFGSPTSLPDIDKAKPFPEVKTETRQNVAEKKADKIIEDDHFEYEGGVVLYPPTMKVNRNTEDFDKDPDWPSDILCRDSSIPKTIKSIYPVFMPFENKGIRIKSLLTDKIGVKAQVEHELPWHPPTCPQDKEAAAFTQKKSQKPPLISDVVQTDELKFKLLEYVGEGNIDLVKNMQDAEIGHRIYVAMQMKLAPKWLLYTLSSLYWRVRGNNINALNCLLTASRTVQTKYKDIVLVSLASIYLEMGYFDESLVAAEEAFKFGVYEPATNFILAELNMVKKHRNTHMFHLKQVVRLDAGFLGGVARRLLRSWSCLFKLADTTQEMVLNELTEGDICTQMEPGINMVCDKDRVNCHMTNIHCFNARDKAEGKGGTLLRMLEIKDNGVQKSNPDEMDDSLFDTFIDRMPVDRRDKYAHYKNFEVMRDTIDNALKGCGPRGCHRIQAEDLALKEEDCSYQHLQLGYWVHIISFKQLLSDSNLRLPTEIISMTPSSKKVPDCKISVDPIEDFYLERLLKVDTEGWDPVLSLMHQFAEMFNFFDYVTLGAKIAKYVDLKPRSWLGLIGAGWWCGAGGRGACAARCLAAAHAHAPPHHAQQPLRALAALLHMQSKPSDAKDIAYLAFYTSPKSKIESFLVAVSHTYMAEYEQAVWMYRYALTFDDKFLPAKACLHATMCLMLFGENAKTQPKEE